MLYPSAAAESASTTPEAQRLISVIAGTPGEEDEDVDTWLISGREWKIKINNQISVCGGDGLVGVVVY